MAKPETSIRQKSYYVNLFKKDMQSKIETIVKETLKGTGYRRAIINSQHVWPRPIINSIITTPPYFLDEGFNPNDHIGNFASNGEIPSAQGVERFLLDSPLNEYTNGPNTLDNTGISLKQGHVMISLYDNHMGIHESRRFRALRELWSMMPEIDEYYADFADMVRNLNIFVMDDDKNICRFFNNLNELSHKEIFHVFSMPSEILESDTRIQPDAILLDLYTKETHDDESLLFFHKNIGDLFPAPRYIMSGAYFGDSLSKIARLFFQKPTSALKMFNGMSNDILRLRLNSGIMPFIANITGATGTAKSELALNLVRNHQEFCFATMLTDREARPGERGPTAYVHTTSRNIKKLNEAGVATLLHYYGNDMDAGGTSEDSMYAVFHSKKSLKEMSEDRMIPKRLQKELSKSQSLEEILKTGRIALTTISGINHTKAGDEYSNVMNFELMPNVYEGLDFHDLRGTPHRKRRAILDRIELSEVEGSGPYVHLVNRHLLDGSPESLEYRLDSIASSVRDHSKMFTRLGMPKSSYSYYSGLIGQAISQTIHMNEENVGSIDEVIWYLSGTEGRKPYLVSGGSTIEVLDIQKINGRNHYVLVLGNRSIVDKRRRISHGLDTKTDYMSLGKRLIIDCMTEAMGETYLLKSDPSQYTGNVDNAIYFPQSTGIHTPKGGNYSFVMEFGSQLLIRDGKIEDIPALTIILSDKHDIDDSFRFVTPAEVEHIYYSNPAEERIYSGHFGRYFNYLDAKKVLSSDYDRNHSSRYEA